MTIETPWGMYDALLSLIIFGDQFDAVPTDIFP